MRRPADFYGVDQDADAFARAIIRYVTKFDRWDSPKFLFGESYGTTRSGALAYQLQDRGIALNGVVLLSSIMNYGRRQPGLDRDYHQLHPELRGDRLVPSQDDATRRRRSSRRPPKRAPSPRAPMRPRSRRARRSARRSAMPVAQQMSALTGLSPDFIERANLRVDLSRAIRWNEETTTMTIWFSITGSRLCFLAAIRRGLLHGRAGLDRDRLLGHQVLRGRRERLAHRSSTPTSARGRRGRRRARSSAGGAGRRPRSEITRSSSVMIPTQRPPSLMTGIPGSSCARITFNTRLHPVGLVDRRHGLASMRPARSAPPSRRA